MKSLVQLLNEIGEGSKEAFEWKEVRQSTIGPLIQSDYSFSGKVDYMAYIHHLIPEKLIELGFGAKIEKNDDIDFEGLTNQNEWSKVITTVMEILISYVKLHETEIDYIVLTPSRNSEDDTRRERLYMAYAKKNIHKLPGQWEARMAIDEIHITRKKGNPFLNFKLS